MDPEKLSLMAMHLIPGVGDVLMKQLIAYCGSASGVFKKPKGKLEKIPGVGPSVSKSIAAGGYLEKAAQEFEKAKKKKKKKTKKKKKKKKKVLFHFFFFPPQTPPRPPKPLWGPSRIALL